MRRARRLGRRQCSTGGEFPGTEGAVKKETGFDGDNLTLGVKRRKLWHFLGGLPEGPISHQGDDIIFRKARTCPCLQVLVDRLTEGQSQPVALTLLATNELRLKASIAS